MITINAAYAILKHHSKAPLSHHSNITELSSILDDIISIQITKGYKQGWVYYRFLKKSKHLKLSLRDYLYVARWLGYKQIWAQYQYSRKNR